MSYNRDEYGGGGSSGQNYYDQNNDFSEQPRHGHGHGHQGGEQEYRGGEQEYRGGNDEYRGGGGRGGQQEYRGGNDEYRGGGGRGGEQEYRDTRYNGPDSYSGGDDFSAAAQHANEHHGDSSHGSLFDNATSYLNERKSHIQQGDYEVDEQHAVQSHQAMYGGGSSEGQSHDSSTVGAGAAMQALKMFTGGSGSSSDGGFDKNKLIGMAMSQAGKLWDEKQSGGASMVSYLCLGVSAGLYCIVLTFFFSSLVTSSLLLTAPLRWL